MTHSHSTGVLRAVLLGLVVVGPGFQPVAAAQGDDARFLHALIVADTNDPNVGQDVKIDANNVNMRLVTEVPRHRRSITSLEGSRVTVRDIEDYYSRLDVRSSDSVFFFFAGHGGTDQDGGHFLRMTREPDLLRSDLRRILERKGARLTVLLTDTCANYGTPPRMAAAPAMGGRVEACRYLFFRHRGIVDINSASPGQRAFGDKQRGGLFTRVLAEGMALANEVVDKNQDGIVSWGEFAEHLEQGTEAIFREYAQRWGLDQSNQTPYIMQNAEPVTRRPIPRSRWRFGINTFDTNGRGVRIGEVFADSPAEWYGFRTGEILYRMAAVFDGEEREVQQVRTERDFARIVDEHPSAVMFKCWLRSGSGGGERSIYVRLHGDSR